MLIDVLYKEKKWLHEPHKQELTGSPSSAMEQSRIAESYAGQGTVHKLPATGVGLPPQYRRNIFYNAT